jgi:beta-lactam-binding protein with PASTA domain
MFAFRFLLSLIFLLIYISPFPTFAQRPPQIEMYIPRISVPDVRGRPLAVAQRTLTAVGLKAGKVSVAAGPGIVGTVQQQEPAQNSFVARGTVFDLILVAASQPQRPEHSDENFTVQVPPLNGLTQNEASNRLQTFHLQLGSVLLGSGRGKIDTIYDQKPGRGSWVKQGTKVDVAIVQSSPSSDTHDITQPPVYVIVPDLRGQTQNGATEILLKYRLRLGDVSTGLASVPTGTIYGQMPPSGAKVPLGTAVRVYIAQAQPKILVNVPNLSHMDIGAARTLLTQVGLQLGDLSYEESDAAPNSVTSQSLESGTQVERGTPVNVVVAQPPATVEVPDLVNHEEAQAITLLTNAGLQMGSISERASPASSGTVLTQNPRFGLHVRKGTNVDVVVSRQIATTLTVMLGSANPQKGKELTIHAHLEPSQSRASYQFEFGDGQSSPFLSSSETTHTYNSSGDFQVLAFARIGTSTIQSEPVRISIPGPPIGTLVGIGAGTLVLAFGGYRLRGRALFHRFIRLVPELDPGTQRVSMEVGAAWGNAVRICIQGDQGIQSIYWSQQDSSRKEDRS